MNENETRTARPGFLRGEHLALVVIAAALVLIPAGIDQPGLPNMPRGDEATYRLMIESWRVDGDLAVTDHDLPRLFEAFPFAEPSVMLATDGESLRYAPRALYALVAAPASILLGPAGPLSLNGLLLAWCLFLGWRHLTRAAPETVAGAARDGGTRTPGALLVSAVFVLLSPLFAYAYYSQPELLATALVWTSLYLAWHLGRKPLRVLARAFAAGTMAALATCLQPLTLVVAVPICVRALRARRLALPAIVAGLAFGLALTAFADRLGGLPMTWPWTSHESTTHASRDDTSTPAPARFEARILNPLQRPLVPEPATEPAPSAPFRRAAGAILWGRHAGFFAYFPLALLALGLASLGVIERSSWGARLLDKLPKILRQAGPRRPQPMPERVDRLSSSALLVAFALAVVWAGIVLARGHGGSLDPLGKPVSMLLLMPGNRFLAPLYPLFFFLLRRPVPLLPTMIAGTWTVAILGAILITPFGMPVAGYSPQAHTRGWALRSLPLELEWLPALPDYVSQPVIDGTLWMRIDETYPTDDTIGTLGGIATELWLEATAPIDNLHLSLRNLAIENEVRLRFGQSEDLLAFADTPPRGERRPLHLRPGPPTKTLQTRGEEHLYYALQVETTRGARPIWRAEERNRAYTGVEIAYLGSDAHLGQDVYGLTWLGCGAPATVHAETKVQVMAQVRNTSPSTWPNEGAARVRLAARWYRADRKSDQARGRADFTEPVQAGQTAERWIRMQAPTEVGIYTIKVDAVFENVAWFSDHGIEPCTMTVKVIPAEEPEEGGVSS